MNIADDFGLAYADVLLYAELERTGRVTIWNKAAQDRLLAGFTAERSAGAFLTRIREVRRLDRHANGSPQPPSPPPPQGRFPHG